MSGVLSKRYQQSRGINSSASRYVYGTVGVDIVSGGVQKKRKRSSKVCPTVNMDKAAMKAARALEEYLGIVKPMRRRKKAKGKKKGKKKA